MSILSTSPSNTRVFDMEIAEALGDLNAAVIIQQLHYWMQKEGVGTLIDGAKYVYNTFDDWVNEQFRWLTIWQFRKSMNLLRSLEIVKVIRYKASEWNQTNYYSLDYDRLFKFLNWKTAQSTEISEMCPATAQDVNNQHLEVRDSKLSYKESKTTPEEKTAEQCVVAPEKKGLEKEESYKQPKHHLSELTAPPGQKNTVSADAEEDISQEKNLPDVDYIVNKQWKSHVQQLDSAGVPINPTVVRMVKKYKEEAVESAIAIFKVRKREQHIPNPAGYFVQALKEGWGNGGSAIALESNLDSSDRASIFRYWYDLARELGYCSSTEMRDGQQWVCLSGSWEKWEDAVSRGYSLEYLKKVLKRNQGR